MEPVYISHSIDEPPKLFFWSIDEAMPFFVALAVGIITGRLLPMIILGVVVSRVSGGFLARASEKYFMHLCYWKFGVTFGGGTFVPESFDREFIV